MEESVLLIGLKLYLFWQFIIPPPEPGERSRLKTH